jgi:hypothetical protein
LILVLCGFNVLGAQNVLPGYGGFWDLNVFRFDILKLVEFYPDKLPFVRNEIYAQYGRPFVNQIYRDYFRAQKWYQEKNNFSESWLTQREQTNAAFILSLEQSVKSIDEIIPIVLRNIEYTDGTAILTFTSRQQLVWSDGRVDFSVYGSDYGAYGSNWSSKKTLPWAVMGDWILVYSDSRTDFLKVVAYRVNHTTRRILDHVDGLVNWEDLVKLLRSQNRLIPAYG